MIELAPSEFYLSQNYPNPFKGQTAIKYCVACRARVILEVYNSDGAMIRQLVDEEKPAGTYEAIWDASNLPMGIYVCRMSALPLEGQDLVLKQGQADQFSQTKKLVLQN
jgi:Secretion system C-terminal sorting domain